ncbi:MAG: SpoIIE family protein phosphatase [Anaerolineales bacterium]|jgi:serine phosphatase RsbU (regulator of sigma subunit)
MSWLNDMQDAPASARFHRHAIDQIIECVEEGTYCALLGPRLSGKTVLLRYVEKLLSESLGWTCVYVDLRSIGATTQQGFFLDLIQLIRQRLCELLDQSPEYPEEEYASSAVFRGFLADCVISLERNIVLIIEHLETVPVDLDQALLTSLRAAFMDHQTLNHRATVVVSGALSLATLTVGESSPFRGIARRVFVGDLTNAESMALIQEYLEEEGVTITGQALRRLHQATKGDHFLIRKICQRSVEALSATSGTRLGSRDINRVVNRFLRHEVLEYAPLLEAVRLIEEDPDLIRCMVMLLERGTVSRAELPIPLSPDLDPLFLTGVVENVPPDSYRIQNTVYRQFFEGHFTPGRVGRLLSMAGRWDMAIDYLEEGIMNGDEQSRADLLPAVVNSMYAAEDLTGSAHFLIRGLAAAFGVAAVQVWYMPHGESNLVLIGRSGTIDDNLTQGSSEISISADQLEARAYRQGVSVRGFEDQGRVSRAIPLIVQGRKPLGVVTVHNDTSGERFIEQRERDVELAGYLNQAARALHAVKTRRQELSLAGRMQASLMPSIQPEIPGWEIAATWRPARETSGDFYDFIELPDGKLGFVLADVTDKGMGAALYMALSRTLIRTYAAEHLTRPDLVINAANQRMLTDTEGGLFITVFYGLLDPDNGKLTYCNAGHNPPYIINSQDNVQPLGLGRTGIPIGLSANETWEFNTLQMNGGDVLVIYTDGIVDAQNGEMELYGEGRMLEKIGANRGQPAVVIKDDLIANVQAFVGDEIQFDDITLMVIKRNQ